MRIILILFLTFTFGFSKKEDYSEMSNEELIAIMGYVKQEKKKSFEKELKSRIPTMTSKEKEEYEKNREKKNEK